MEYLKIILALAIITPLAILSNQTKIKSEIKEIEQQVIYQVAGGEAADGELTGNGRFNRADFLMGLENSAELPISSVAEYPAASSSQGLAILLPQNHRYPGTAVSDPRNDSAEVTQNQIYGILDHIASRINVGFIMSEGDIYGQSQGGEKTGRVKELIGLRDELERQIAGLEENCAETDLSAREREQVLAHAEKELVHLNRTIALAGAPYRLAAEREGITLVGAETLETYKECAQLVRNYTYQKDQLASCQESPGLAFGQTAANSGQGLARLAALLDSLRTPEGATTAGLAGPLKSLLGASTAGLNNRTGLNGPTRESNRPGSPACDEAIDGLESTYGRIARAEAVKADDEAAPRREDNPYSGITDPAVLEDMIDETEADIQEMVIDQRNTETAVNFKAAMTDSGSSVGILQFGAGHEAGLVSELNTQGLDVIVVKPEEVARREQSDQAAVPSSLAAIKKLIENN